MDDKDLTTHKVHVSCWSCKASRDFKRSPDDVERKASALLKVIAGMDEECLEECFENVSGRVSASALALEDAIYKYRYSLKVVGNGREHQSAHTSTEEAGNG